MLAVGAVVSAADDHTVLFDRDIDFSTFRTFLVVAPTVSSVRPELKFPALTTSIVDVARETLVARGLSEGNASADLALTVWLFSVDYGIGPYGRPGVVNGPLRGRSGASSGLTVDYTEASLVIDLHRRSDRLLIWRGVYHDEEKDQGKFAGTLPKGAASLLSQYPPRKAK